MCESAAPVLQSVAPMETDVSLTEADACRLSVINEHMNAVVEPEHMPQPSATASILYSASQLDKAETPMENMSDPSQGDVPAEDFAEAPADATQPIKVLEETCIVESQVSLEEYKLVIDATTQLPASIDRMEANTEDAEDQVANLDVSTDDAMDVEDTDAPLQVTVEWQQQATGIMMGYALCGDNDQDVQTMHQLFEDQSEVVEEAQTQTNSSDETVTTMLWESEMGVPAFVDRVCQWKEPTTGVMMGYACDDDSDFGDHIELTKRELEPEWIDPKSGALMGYVCDDASDFGDHLEYQDDDVEGMHERESQVSCDSPIAKRQRIRRAAFKRRPRPLVLQLRSLHVRQVIKSSMRK